MMTACSGLSVCLPDIGNSFDRYHYPARFSLEVYLFFPDFDEFAGVSDAVLCLHDHDFPCKVKIHKASRMDTIIPGVQQLGQQEKIYSPTPVGLTISPEGV